MDYASDAKVVKGLSIANIVLSALGIVLALVIGVGGTVAAGYLMGYVEENGSPVYQAIESDDDAAKVYNELKGIVGGLTVDDTEALANIVGSTSAHELHELGSAISLANYKDIKHCLKNIKSETGIEYNVKELATTLANLDASTCVQLGVALTEVTDEDIDDLASALGSMTQEDIDGMGEVLGSIEDGGVEAIGAAAVMAIIWVLVAFMIVSGIISLVAGILGLRNAANPNKLTGAFVWGIVAAVIALCCGRIITMVIQIIAVVYINKVRKFRDGAVPPTANPANMVPPAAPEA